MRALRITKKSPDDPPGLSVTTVPRPKNEPGQLLIKIKASAVLPSDLLNAKGGFEHTMYPRIPGRDFSGVVVDGPANRMDQEVYGTSGGILGFTTDGAHAEYCVVPEDLVAEKPRSLSHVQAASVGVPFTIALLCLNRARVTKEDSVLVIGANGAVGSAVVQIATALECHTVLRATRDDQADVNTSTDHGLEKVKSLTSDKGVNVIVDTVGDLALMQSAIAQLAPRGRYAFMAAPRGGASTVLELDILQAYRKQIKLIGCNSVAMDPAEVQSALSLLKNWFEEGKIGAKAQENFEIVNFEKAEDAYHSDGRGLHVLVM